MSINIHRMFEYLFCADESSSFLNLRFENDVKMYGTQTIIDTEIDTNGFENDVKMYGTQTPPVYNPQMTHGLRMM